MLNIFICFLHRLTTDYDYADDADGPDKCVRRDSRPVSITSAAANDCRHMRARGHILTDRLRCN